MVKVVCRLEDRVAEDRAAAKVQGPVQIRVNDGRPSEKRREGQLTNGAKKQRGLTPQRG